MTNATARGNSPEKRFEILTAQWKAGTLVLSSVEQIAMHPAYQQIIGMGPNAVPLILQRLRTEGPDHWFWALGAITGEDPVAPEHRGNMVQMTDDWLAWADQEAPFLQRNA